MATKKGGRKTPPRSGAPQSERAPKRQPGVQVGSLGSGTRSSTGPMRSRTGWVVPGHPGERRSPGSFARRYGPAKPKRSKS